MQQPGRPRKGRKNRGRPTSTSTTALIHQIQAVAPPSMVDEQCDYKFTHSSVCQSDVECPMCLCVLDRPVELHCGPLVCAGCCSQWIQSFGHPATPCPCCYSSDPLSIVDIRPPPPLVVKLLGNLLVHKCTDHNHFACEVYSSQPSCCCCISYIYVPPITIQDMLSHPPKTPVLESERQIAGKIVTRLLHSSPDDTLTVPTGGKVTCGIPLLNRVAWFQGSYSQPLTLMRVPKATVPTSKASAKTVARRNQALHQLRDTISGGDSSSQMQEEIRSLSKGERQKILKEANLTIDIPPEHGVAMKADLALPWNKLRILRR